MKNYVLSLDAGTTSSRSILFDKSGNQIAVAQEEFSQFSQKKSWVEHDPNEIWQTQLNSIKTVIEKSSINPENIDSIGITNQRETTIIWNKNTGEPVYNAIVWQDRRTAKICKDLIDAGQEPIFSAKTGLLIDAYFSGTKIKWILDNSPELMNLAEKGELAFGTVDSWLIWKLTAGAKHVTDATNASRTLLYNIHQGKWDEELLKILGVPKSMLPKVVNSSEIVGTISKSIIGSNSN